MKPTLMLDVDGVLVHSAHAGSWATDIEQDLGIDPQRLAEEFFAQQWPDVIVGKKALMPVLEECLPTLSPDVRPETFIDYWFSRDSTIDDAVLADVSTLRSNGVAVWLTTNQEHMRARYLMETMGLGDHVEGIIYSAALGTKKPERPFFNAAARRTGDALDRHVLVDDSKTNVTAAREAGWHAFHWTRDQSLLRIFDQLG
ncbi:HAD-IA family hydrolase [Martelella mangrovi]|uniref:Hydrolase of the HAD superfamily n=1 Tax=Martelella mangrovi TaxID=1397477 RepID=A0ABV2IBL2_9HYPH